MTAVDLIAIDENDDACLATGGGWYLVGVPFC